MTDQATGRIDAAAFAGNAAKPGLVGPLTSLIPTGLFLLVDAQFGLVPAMIAASLASVVVMVVRRSSGRRMGILLPLSLVYVVVKAVAGVVTQSQVVYFGAGLVLSALIALAVGASAFTSRPVALYFLPHVVPYRRLSTEHPAYRRVAAQITAVWAVAELSMTAWEARHLAASTASGFVVARTVIAWPVMAGVIFFLVFYVRFRLDPYEFSLAHAEQT